LYSSTSETASVFEDAPAVTKEIDMNRILKTAILSTAVAAMTLTALPAANARDWRRHHGNHDALAAGVLGLATGALIAGALSSPRPAYADDAYIYDDDGYYDDGYYQQRRYYVRQRPVVVRRYYGDGYALEPWTREWVRYCSNRYRSFDARSGTFTGYDGQQHFCNAN
jgi:hypothetical protein